VSFTSKPEQFMAAADIFCLPSFREGFGVTIIEAAACGLPAVATRIYGITDAIQLGKTGLLVTPGDVTSLTHALSALINDNGLRETMGSAARERAFELFSSEMITHEMEMLYDALYDRSVGKNGNRPR
jgi:glycosyltransferase involved in cell wall biosynthesis